MNKMLNFPIYLDNHSTTRVDPIVFESMKPFFTEMYGNAQANHMNLDGGRNAVCESSRKKIAGFIGAEKNEIIFTSGTTESINLALKGTVQFFRNKKNKIITAQPSTGQVSMFVNHYLIQVTK